MARAEGRVRRSPSANALASQDWSTRTDPSHIIHASPRYASRETYLNITVGRGPLAGGVGRLRVVHAGHWIEGPIRQRGGAPVAVLPPGAVPNATVAPDCETSRYPCDLGLEKIAR